MAASRLVEALRWPGETRCVPLLAVLCWSVSRRRSRRHRLQLHAGSDLLHLADADARNYVTIFESTSYISFLWSLGLATLTVILLAIICYPVAYGLHRVFGRWSMLMTLLFTIPLFVSENVRLYGWILFFIKNGVLLGSLKTFFGFEPESFLFTRTAIVLGMVYVYLPFMLFPDDARRAMVPSETREAASDLGASRWQVFREVELPLSMPGIVIGFLLTFVLAVGAIAEAKVWAARRSSRSRTTSKSPSPMPRTGRSALRWRCLLMLVVGVLVVVVLRRFDLDAIPGRRRTPWRAVARVTR